MDEGAQHDAGEDHGARGDADLAFDRDHAARILVDGQSGLLAGIRTALDDEGLEAAGRELLGRHTGPAAGGAEEHDGLLIVAGEQRANVEVRDVLEGQIDRALDATRAELGGRTDVEQERTGAGFGHHVERVEFVMAIRGQSTGGAAGLDRTAGGGGRGDVHRTTQGEVADIRGAADVVGVEAMLAEQARGHVGAEAAVAGDRGGLGLIEFAEASAQGVERDVVGMLGADELELGALVGVTDIDYLVGRQIDVGLDDGSEAIEVVHRGEGGHVQRILGRAEGRGVGEIDLREVADGAAEVQERGDDVETLVDAGGADGLRAEDAARAGFVDELQRERLRTGVIAGMVVGGDVDGAGLHATLEGRLQGVARDAGAEAEDLDDGRAPGGGRLGGLAGGGVFADETTGAVGDARERDASALAGGTDEVFRGVADGVDVLVSRALILVGQDAACRAHAESGGDGELVVGTHAQAEDDEVGFDGDAVLEDDARGLTGRFADGREAGAGDQADALAEEFATERFGHLGVERRQHLTGAFDQGDVEPAFLELFGDLEADEARADHGHLLDRRQLGEDAVHVLDVAEGMHALGADAGDVGDERGRAGGEDQLIVGFVVFGAGDVVADAHGLLGAVDREGLMADADLDVEALLEHLGLRHEQLGAVLDRAAEVVGEAAVGEGDVGILLQHDDAGVFVQTTGARGGRGAAGDAADDEDLRRGGHRIIWRIGNGCSRGSKGSPHGPRGSGRRGLHVRRRPGRGRGGASGAG